jgi:hypothetical protein
MGRNGLVVIGALLLSASLHAAGQAGQAGQAAAPGPGGGGRGNQPPRPAKAGAPIDLTGYWVAVISEDWRWRMLTPAKGDYASIPINLEAKKVADTWDPSRDDAVGDRCKSYEAPGLMRAATQRRLTWLDHNPLTRELDCASRGRTTTR